MNLIFKFIDYFYQRKKYDFLKKKIDKKIDIFFDIGAHHGETIQDFLKFFSINKIYAFEPSKSNFSILKKKIDQFKLKYNELEIEAFPYGLGNQNKILDLNEIKDGESNTFNDIDTNSNYFKKKKKIITFFGLIKFFKKKVPTKIIKLQNFIIEKKIDKIDFIKIDTEGFEYNILLGLENYITRVNYILLEHHFDDMIIKNYKLTDLHNLLQKNNFKKIFKIKMPFRKSFDYIYKNNNF